MRYISYMGGECCLTPQQKKLREELKEQQEHKGIQQTLRNLVSDSLESNTDLDAEDKQSIESLINQTEFSQYGKYEDTYVGEIVTDDAIFNIAIEDDEVTIEKISIDYVDLGLPSGTLWATKNIGAQHSTQRGYYFSWGNLEGYVASYTEGDYQGTIVGYSFIQDNYELTSGYQLSESISVENDAAYDNLGGEWRIPSDTQFQELIDNCTITWVTRNGIPGKLFTSNINGRTLFIVNNGYGNATTLDSPMYQAAYWTNVEDEVNTNKALAFALSTSILPNLTTIHPEEKRFGFGIRPVIIPSIQA